MEGFSELQEASSLFGDCNYGFVCKYTAEQLLKIYRIHKKTGWDIYPDSWEERQIQEALHLDKIPRWQYNTEDKVIALYRDEV